MPQKTSYLRGIFVYDKKEFDFRLKKHRNKHFDRKISEKHLLNHEVICGNLSLFSSTFTVYDLFY